MLGKESQFRSWDTKQCYSTGDILHSCLLHETSSFENRKYISANNTAALLSKMQLIFSVSFLASQLFQIRFFSWVSDKTGKWFQMEHTASWSVAESSFFASRPRCCLLIAPCILIPRIDSSWEISYSFKHFCILPINRRPVGSSVVLISDSLYLASMKTFLSSTETVYFTKARSSFRHLLQFYCLLNIRLLLWTSAVFVILVSSTIPTAGTWGDIRNVLAIDCTLRIHPATQRYRAYPLRTSSKHLVIFIAKRSLKIDLPLIQNLKAVLWTKSIRYETTIVL